MFLRFFQRFLSSARQLDGKTASVGRSAFARRLGVETLEKRELLAVDAFSAVALGLPPDATPEL